MKTQDGGKDGKKESQTRQCLYRRLERRPKFQFRAGQTSSWVAIETAMHLTVDSNSCVESPIPTDKRRDCLCDADGHDDAFLEVNTIHLRSYDIRPRPFHWTRSSFVCFEH